MKITMSQIYKSALSILFERANEDPDFLYSMPFMLSQVLVELLPSENMNRKMDGRPLLTIADVPILDSMESDRTFDFDERFLRLAVPYALAGLFLADDDSKKAESQVYYNKYVDAVNVATCAVYEPAEEDE